MLCLRKKGLPFLFSCTKTLAPAVDCKHHDLEALFCKSEQHLKQMVVGSHRSCFLQKVWYPFQTKYLNCYIKKRNMLRPYPVLAVVFADFFKFHGWSKTSVLSVPPHLPNPFLPMLASFPEVFWERRMMLVRVPLLHQCHQVPALKTCFKKGRGREGRFCFVFFKEEVYEQDDLSEQMASLEGLMKQLNAITGSAF
ncbi:Netrin receptor DCC [Varanus komodoensis]|nr:Netrin receptor DCC [Varanus komodoensis]